MNAKDNCHHCGNVIGNAEIPGVAYVVFGPAVRGQNVTPEEFLEAYGSHLAPFIRANLSKRVARSTYCMSCANKIFGGVPQDEVERISDYAIRERA